MPQVACNTCGSMVYRRPHVVAKSRYTFCGYQCKYNYDHTVAVPCTSCGKELKRNPAFAARSPHHFCDLKCRDAFRAQGKFARASKAPCLICGKVVVCVRPSKKTVLCSRKCQGIWQAQHRTGNNASNWKGGFQSYYGPNWRAQQRAARKRDGYKCQYCGVTQIKTKRALDVHHIRPFREFWYIPGKNENYKQANDLTNLISLCTACHTLAEHGKIAIQPYLI